MRILGLDPGVAAIGFGIVDGRSFSSVSLLSCGCIRTRPGTPLGARLIEVRRDLLELIERHRPEEAAMETIFFNINVRTALVVAQTRGVLLLALAEAGLSVAEYGPQAVKKAVVGYGNGTKSQVQAMVARVLHLSSPPRPDDAADAVAVALCHRFTISPMVESARKK
jgi:crossover junction endodeoxyribonuclease RuvC